jgi:hypothetical protein
MALAFEWRHSVIWVSFHWHLCGVWSKAFVDTWLLYATLSHWVSIMRGVGPLPGMALAFVCTTETLAADQRLLYAAPIDLVNVIFQVGFCMHH